MHAGKSLTFSSVGCVLRDDGSLEDANARPFQFLTDATDGLPNVNPIANKLQYARRTKYSSTSTFLVASYWYPAASNSTKVISRQTEKDLQNSVYCYMRY